MVLGGAGLLMVIAGRDRQFDHRERIKHSLRGAAIRAGDHRPELATEEVSDDALVPGQVPFPHLFAGQLCIFRVVVQVNFRLELALEEVLRDEVEHRVDGLRAVVLRIVVEDLVILAQLLLNILWVKFSIAPLLDHLFDQFAPGPGEIAF